MVIFSQTTNKSEDQKKGEKLAFELVQKVSFTKNRRSDQCGELKFLLQTDGGLCAFEEAMVQLVYIEKKKQRSVPWNCDLQIGSHLEIKVSAYVYVISSTFGLRLVILTFLLLLIR